MRTSHNTVLVISMITPNHMDMDTEADSPTTSPGVTNLPSPSPLDVIPQALLPPPSGVALRTPCPPPTPLPARGGAADHLITENDPSYTSEIPPQTPPSFRDDHDCNPPPALSPPVCSPAESSIPSCSSTPTPETILPQPLLACTGSGTFDLTGIHGSFISEDTRAYLESVPGGEEWVSLVKSYLKLEAIPPLKGVSSRLGCACFEQTNIVPSNTSALQRHLDRRSCKTG